MVSQVTLYKKVLENDRIVLANAFSINMLGREDVGLRFVKLTLEEVKYLVTGAIKRGKEIKSIIGHQSTAELMSNILGFKVEANREFYQMQDRDLLLVIQLKERLQEGQVLSKEEIEKKLEEGKIEFWAVWRI